VGTPGLVLAGAFLCFIVVAALSMGFPLARPLSYAAWAASVFTAEAALAGAGVTAGTLTPAKLLPLGILVSTSAWFLIESRRSARPAFTPPLRWAALYVGWLAICAVMSQDPTSAAIRIVQIALPLGAILAARRIHDRPSGYIVGAVLGCAAHVAYAVIFDPNYVGPPGAERLTGLLVPNTFGLAVGLTIAGAFGYWLGMTRRPIAGLSLFGVIAVCLYALVEAASRTAAIATLVAVVLVLVATRRSGIASSRTRGIVTGAALLGIALYAVLQPVLLTTTTSLFNRGNESLATLTGRVPLWGHLLTAIADRPFFGYGPSAYRDGEITLIQYLSVPEAGLAVSHNALIEALVAGGLPGGLLWLMLMISLAKHVSRVPDVMRPAALAIYVVNAVAAITTSSAAGIGIGWYVVLALSALVVRSDQTVSGELPAAATTAQTSLSDTERFGRRRPEGFGERRAPQP
jgi:O-antigen ligase